MSVGKIIRTERTEKKLEQINEKSEKKTSVKKKIQEGKEKKVTDSVMKTKGKDVCRCE